MYRITRSFWSFVLLHKGAFVRVTHIYIYFLSFCLFRAAHLAYGVSQARGRIGAVAANLCQSHSNA